MLSISFTVVRSRDGQEFKTVYKGKGQVEGEMIKDKSSSPPDDPERSRDRIATRVR